MPKFVPRQRKHKVLARQKNNSVQSLPTDENATEILPAEQRAQNERKKALKDALIRDSETKMSAKKKKRLDKYIDTKMKKEENLTLLKKLAAQKVDTSLLQSSKKLGSGEGSKKDKLRRALAERRRGIDVEKNESLLLERRREVEMDDYSSSEDEVETTQVPTVSAHAASPPPKQDRASPEPKESSDVSNMAVGTRGLFSGGGFGSGLKRPLDLDDSGKPVIQTRKRRKAHAKPVLVEEVEWEGFSSGSEEEQSDAGNSDSAEDMPSLRSEPDDSSEDDKEDEVKESSDSSEEDSESEDEENESETSSDGDSGARKKERISFFTKWAAAKRNEAVGFIPSTNLDYALPAKPENFKPREPESEPLPPELRTDTATDATRKAFSVAIERSPEMQEARLQLPIVAEEQKIMEAIHNNDVVVIWGATGSGKTTQVPQFLYEAGYGAPEGPTPGMIGVTQPRRVAAVSMSTRVGDELGKKGSQVAHQIRFDTTVGAQTAIKFMTDGVLLREISRDFSLAKYSAIVIDEAHERSVNTDVLIGMLSRIVDLRADMAREDPKKTKPLKLIIMSATLRISDFTHNKRLFRHGPPPLLKAEGRQYTVTNHFARRTQRDYVEEVFHKICRGHRKLPRGGMLVFLTGQNEIMHLSKKLKETFSSTQGQEPRARKVQVSPAEASLEEGDIDLGAQRDDYQDSDGYDSDGSLITGLDDEDDREFDIGEEKAEDAILKVHVLPLYSQLPPDQQLRVFEPPPDGSRLIVLATNVAETSLTIPGIRYVFDCGRAKEKKYDPVTGVQSFEIGWISKASANQRAGRAGRTGHGHCYRLYSSAVFERDFEEYATPEILRTPLEDVVLQLKSLNAPIRNFPFPTPPDHESLQKAENLLAYLGAISSDGKVTSRGRQLTLYPLNPRFARMLVFGVDQNLAAETIALVAALSISELIIPENKLGLREPPEKEAEFRTEADNLEAEERSRLRKAYNTALAKFSTHAKQSDCIKFWSAVCGYAYEPDSQTYCKEMFLNSKAMHEASQLRSQLTAIVRLNRPTAIGAYQAKLPGPSERTINLLKQICATGFIDQVALRADLAPVPPDLPRKPKTAIDVPYITLFASKAGRSRHDDPAGQYVYLHSSSIMARTPPAKLPAFIIYSHLQRAAPSVIGGARTPKTRMHSLTPITQAQLINIALGTPLLQISKPQGNVVDMARDQIGTQRRECVVELTLVGEKGRQGWGLGVRRVVQKKEKGSLVWSIEKILG